MTRCGRVITIAGALAAGLALVSLVDGVVFRSLAWTLKARHDAEGEDWYWLLRNTGSMWAWVLVAGCVWWADATGARRAGGAVRRAGLVFVAPALAGLTAEVLKLVVGRERPAVIVDDRLVYQGYVFRRLLGGFADGTNLGMPSSHTAVAFGGAWMLGTLAPSLRVPGVVLAGGCAVTRLLAGAHFASDVYVGMVLGVGAAWALGRWVGGVGPRVEAGRA